MASTFPQSDAPAEFLFTTAPNSALVTSFKVNADGSLLPLPGSPFRLSARALSLISAHGMLIAGSDTGIYLYSVDKQTGSIQQTDSVRGILVSRVLPGPSADAIYVITQTGALAYRVAEGRLLPASVPASDVSMASSPPAVLDATERFMYVVDADKAEVLAYRVDRYKAVPLSPPSYSLSRGTSALTLVAP